MRSDFFGFWIKIVIFVVIAGTIINDGGSIIYGYYRVGDEASRVATEGLRGYKLFDRNPDQALASAKLKAEQDGTILTGFQVTREAIRVSIEIPPKTTWVAHRIQSLRPYLSAKGQLDLPLN